MSIIIALLVFGIVVLIHEMGHFFAARRCGIRVDEFAIGMGPKIWSYKKSETEFTLRLFPIGGSCRMHGEDADIPDEEDSFNSKPVWQRTIVICAGVFMNFMLALLLSSLLAFLGGYGETVIKEVSPGTPAETNGLLPGDRLLKINNKHVLNFMDFRVQLSQTGGNPVTLLIERDGSQIEKTIVPAAIQNKDGSTSYQVGFLAQQKYGLVTANIYKEEIEASGTKEIERAGFFDSIEQGFYTDIFYIKYTLSGLADLVTGKVGVDQMSGPIGVVSIIGETYQESIKEEHGGWLAIERLLSLTALISANLAVVNMLPIPALDGGRLIFLILEAIRRKPVKPETEGIVHFVGFILLMILAVVIAFNDVIKLI